MLYNKRVNKYPLSTPVIGPSSRALAIQFVIPVRLRLNGRHFAEEDFQMYCIARNFMWFKFHLNLLQMVHLTHPHPLLVPHVYVTELGQHWFR